MPARGGQHRGTTDDDGGRRGVEARGGASGRSAQRNGAASKLRRAKIRHIIFTTGPNRLSGGLVNRRHIAQDVAVRDLELSSPLWPRDFDGLRIAHVSDFHLGELMPLPRAMRIVEKVAAAKPDVVACTGDVVDLHNDQAPPLLQAIAAIESTFGSVLVLGNHDELHDRDELVQMAHEAGLPVLRNQVIEMKRGGARLTIAGIEWGRSAIACARHVDSAVGHFAHVLLAHNPKAFGRAAHLGIPLTLAGHTHGGQVAMKSNPRRNLHVTSRLSAGVYQRGMSRLYVTSGVGAWFPLRLNCPAEIAMITMRHADEHPPTKKDRRRVRRARNRG
jgi:predicted MPP superfamily phosphohydrolase